MYGGTLHTFDLSPWGVQAGGSLLVQGQPSLFNEFRLSRGYIMRPRLKKMKQNKIH